MEFKFAFLLLSRTRGCPTLWSSWRSSVLWCGMMLINLRTSQWV